MDQFLKESARIGLAPRPQQRLGAVVAPTAHIHVGDTLYVRGDPSADGASIKARVILLDGFQALTATIDSLDALAETVTLHELSTGKPIEVRIRPSDLFLLNPGLDAAQNETSESPHGRKLQTLDFGDLQAGDADQESRTWMLQARGECAVNWAPSG